MKIGHIEITQASPRKFLCRNLCRNTSHFEDCRLNSFDKGGDKGFDEDRPNLKGD
jgi:hypothetical protein